MDGLHDWTWLCCPGSSCRRGQWLSVSSIQTATPVSWPTTLIVAGVSWREGEIDISSYGYTKYKIQQSRFIWSSDWFILLFINIIINQENAKSAEMCFPSFFFKMFKLPSQQPQWSHVCHFVLWCKRWVLAVSTCRKSLNESIKSQILPSKMRSCILLLTDLAYTQ